MKTNNSFAGAFALIVAFALVMPTDALAKSKIYKIVKFEGNGNAYALFDTRFDSNGEYVGFSGIPWSKASGRAQRATFKGVHGRLAIVDSKELDSFLSTTFRHDTHAWIGLKYTCKTKTWEYSDGGKIPANAYTHWHPTKWGNNAMGNTLNCGSLYTGFHAYKGGGDMAPYWALNTSAKFYTQFFVEFPLSEVTGDDTEIVSEDTDIDAADTPPEQDRQDQKNEKHE